MCKTHSQLLKMLDSNRQRQGCNCQLLGFGVISFPLRARLAWMVFPLLDEIIILKTAFLCLLKCPCMML